MRFKYSNGQSSDDCGHTEDDPNCIANGGLGLPEPQSEEADED